MSALWPMVAVVSRHGLEANGAFVVMCCVVFVYVLPCSAVVGCCCVGAVVVLPVDVQSVDCKAEPVVDLSVGCPFLL
eukprot:1161216-Prorocentrum_lima.AAC.1